MPNMDSLPGLLRKLVGNLESREAHLQIDHCSSQSQRSGLGSWGILRTCQLLPREIGGHEAHSERLLMRLYFWFPCPFVGMTRPCSPFHPVPVVSGRSPHKQILCNANSVGRFRSYPFPMFVRTEDSNAKQNIQASCV